MHPVRCVPKPLQARETGICPVREELYAQCFDELIRQVTINCAERGLLLLRVRDEMRMTIAAYQVSPGSDKTCEYDEAGAALWLHACAAMGVQQDRGAWQHGSTAGQVACTHAAWVMHMMHTPLRGPSSKELKYLVVGNLRPGAC